MYTTVIADKSYIWFGRADATVAVVLAVCRYLIILHFNKRQSYVAFDTGIAEGIMDKLPVPC